MLLKEITYSGVGPYYWTKLLYGGHQNHVHFEEIFHLQVFKKTVILSDIQLLLGSVTCLRAQSYFMIEISFHGKVHVLM